MRSFVYGGLLFRACLILLLGTRGCTGVGAQGLPYVRNSNNIAIQDSNNQQMLLNLVRLKCRDNPFFLEVNNVVDQYFYTLEPTPMPRYPTPL